jgi:hypothetical protein
MAAVRDHREVADAAAANAAGLHAWRSSAPDAQGTRTAVDELGLEAEGCVADVDEGADDGDRPDQVGTNVGRCSDGVQSSGDSLGVSAVVE